MQTHVLLQASLQLALLVADGVTAALDDARQQQIRRQSDGGDNGPGAQLRLANLRVQRIGQQVELIDGDDATVTVLAHGRVDLHQSAEVLALIQVLGFVEIADVGADLTVDGLLQRIVDGKLSADECRVRGVQDASVARPDLELNHALTQPGSGNQSVQRRRVVRGQPAIVSRQGLQIGSQDAVDVQRGNAAGALQHAGFNLVADPGAGDEHACQDHEQAGDEVLLSERPVAQQERSRPREARWRRGPKRACRDGHRRIVAIETAKPQGQWSVAARLTHTTKKATPVWGRFQMVEPAGSRTPASKARSAWSSTGLVGR